ncbi:MAG: hypothetical protein KIH69_019410 [Anaerolineae bacterium]|nr:hypothetical protein [Anaerolineae bacterium]
MSNESQKDFTLFIVLYFCVGIYSVLHFRLRIKNMLRRKHSKLLVGLIWVAGVASIVVPEIMQSKFFPSFTERFISLLWKLLDASFISAFFSWIVWRSAEGYYRNVRGMYDIKDD